MTTNKRTFLVQSHYPYCVVRAVTQEAAVEVVLQHLKEKCPEGVIKVESTRIGVFFTVPFYYDKGVTDRMKVFILDEVLALGEEEHDD